MIKRHCEPGRVQKMFSWLARSKKWTAAILCFLALASVILPMGSPVFLVLGIKIICGRRRFVHSWPMAAPMDRNFLDPNTPNPATGKPMPGRGVALIGHDRDGRECWMSDDDLRQHMLVLGCTGAGKTEFLLGLCANALAAGSGFMYMDGKGDISIFAKVSEMCAKMGRSSDLLVLNFMNLDTMHMPSVRGLLRSNTLNPFANGSADGLTQLIVSLMPENGGDGAMWKGRAVALLSGVTRALVFLRDKGLINLTASTMREFMGLGKIHSLLDREVYPELPPEIRRSIEAYLTSLPGYKDGKGVNQAQTTMDQHGYLEMNFSQIFGSLSDVYGHIFNDPLGQIDIGDVVENRRIVLVMLPALEKSQDEISGLGKIVVATLKGVMGATLGSKLDGSWEDVVSDRQPPSKSPFPFMCILDEAGYYVVDGMALMAAQARSLGFSMIYAAQDIPALKRNNEREAASIIANTNTKIFMRTEDVEYTGPLAVMSPGNHEQAGEDSPYTNTISMRDLKSQQSGAMTIVYKGDVVHANAFYVSGDSVKSRLIRKNLRLRANTPVPFIVSPDEIEDEKRKGEASIIANTSTKIFMRTEEHESPQPPLELDSVKEATSIIAATNTKIFMRVEEPEDTPELRIKKPDLSPKGEEE